MTCMANQCAKSEIFPVRDVLGKQCSVYIDIKSARKAVRIYLFTHAGIFLAFT